MIQMTKIQPDCDAEEMAIIELYKLANDLPSKRIALRHMIRTFDKEELLKKISAKKPNGDTKKK